VLNQCILVGRIVDILEEKIIISVPRPYKEEKNGEYISDTIPATVRGSIYENVKEYCNKGDIVGIKGSIRSTNDNMEILVEKISFLSSKKAD